METDIEAMFDALEQRLVARIDLINNRLDQHARHLEVLGAADNALHAADKALERQIANLERPTNDPES
jgi:hypothetical protein